MRLVMGLGNPGERYAATRHNVAWRVLDELERRWDGVPRALPGFYEARRVRMREQPVELMRPLTYMNLAGDALRLWLGQPGGEPADLLVVTDDVYLSLGVLRLRARGSSGGHRGLESLAEALEGRPFARLRIGVGQAQSGSPLAEHVLAAFTPEEEAVVEEAVRRAADAVECWVAEGIQAAMNRFNSKASKEVSES